MGTLLTGVGGGSKSNDQLAVIVIARTEKYLPLSSSLHQDEVPALTDSQLGTGGDGPDWEGEKSGGWEEDESS